MQDRKLYSIKEARALLGGISRNGIYALLRTGELASVIGCRRFISGAAITASVKYAMEVLYLRSPIWPSKVSGEQYVRRVS